jgi:hypothetical protein
MSNDIDEGFSKFITVYSRMGCYCLISVLPFSPPDQRLWMSVSALVASIILIMMEKSSKRKVFFLTLLGGLAASTIIVLITPIFFIHIIVYAIGAMVAYILFNVKPNKSPE